MKIKVRTNEHRFTIPLPSWLLFNWVTAAIGALAINQCIPENILQVTTFDQLSYNELKRLFKEIRKCSRYLQGEPLLSVHSGDGDIVEIFL